MKIFKKVALTFLLLVVCSSPLILTGCFGDDPVEPKIEITTEFKTNYMLGEDLDVTGGILEYTNEKGKTAPVAITSQMVTGFSSSSVGTRQVVVTYEDCAVLVSYTVSLYDIDTTTFYWAVEYSGEGNEPYYYTYIKIDENLKLYNCGEYASTGTGPNASKNDISLYTQISTLTRSIENNKVIYNGEYVQDFGTQLIEIVVENKNTITVKIESTVEAFQNELTFTKF